MRRIRPVILWLMLAAAPVVALNFDPLPNYQDSGTRGYVRGTQKLQDGDYIGAVDDLKQAIRARPDMPDAFHNLGFAFEKTGDLKSAAAAYERAISLRPNYASALNNLGFLLANSQTDVQKAVQFCQRAVELEPGSANYRDSLGWALFKAGRLDDALLSFKASLKVDPAFPKPHFNIGLVEFTKKNYAAAAREFATALQMNPNLLKAYLPLGVCYENLQQNNKALFVYRQALTKAPDGSPIRRHLDKQIKKLTKDSKSFYFSNVKQIQSNSKLADFMQKKSRTGNLTGVSGKVNENFETPSTFTPVSATPGLPSNAPGSDDSYDLRTSAPRAASTAQTAQATQAQRSYSATSSDGELSVSQERQLQKRYELCNSYVQRGLINEAARDLEKITALGGNSGAGRQARSLLMKVRKMLDDRNRESADTHMAMGKDFIRSGKYDMAEAELNKAVAMSPENAEVHKDLALLFYNQGRLKEAYEESKQAIALDRGMKEAYVVLGSLYSKKGRTEDALRTLKRIRELPGDRDAVDDLAERMISSLQSGA